MFKKSYTNHCILKLFIFFFLYAGIIACSPARFVKPLAKKEQALDLSFGGPFFKMGENIIPMPFLTATYGYGIDSTLTGFGSVNITSALYGNFQTEFGLTKQVMRQHELFPGLSLIPVINIIYRDKNAAKLYPQLDVYAWWEYGSHKNMLYTGVSNWFETASTRTLEQKQPNHWLLTPVVGHRFSGEKGYFNIEAKVIAPHLSNEKLIIEYRTPFKSHGAFGIYVGYTRKF